MLSIGKIEKSTRAGLAVDGSDVLAIAFEKTDKTSNGAALFLATDAGDYLFDYSGAVLPVPLLDDSDIINGAGVLLSFIPYNF